MQNGGLKMIKKFKIFYGGKCFHPEKSINKKGSFKMKEFPSLYFFIEFDNNIKMLFDTGYSNIFYEATKKFPFRLYRKLTKVELNDENIEETLKREKIKIEEINYIFISHFHPDHIGNLKLFKKAKYICHSRAYEFLKNKKKLFALKEGYLKEHLPDDFEKRIIYFDKEFKKTINQDLNEFEDVYSIFDNEMYAVLLEGHQNGHSGIYFKYQKYNIFLIADAVWRKDEYEKLEFLPFVSRIVLKNYTEYKKNVIKIHNIYKSLQNIVIIPAHCEERYKEVKKNEDFI